MRCGERGKKTEKIYPYCCVALAVASGFPLCFLFYVSGSRVVSDSSAEAARIVIIVTSSYRDIETASTPPGGRRDLVGARRTRAPPSLKRALLQIKYFFYCNSILSK